MKPVVVFYDLEATGLNRRKAEILQIGARCDGFNFSRYIMPEHGVTPGATDVNGLEVRQGRLCKDGVPVRTMPVQQAWEEFIAFLHICGKSVVLVAHNGFNFDHILTMRAVSKLRLRNKLLKVARLGSDTKQVFPKEYHGKKLINIAREYGVPDDNAHDALGDVDMMRRLCRKMDIGDQDILDVARPMASFL